MTGWVSHRKRNVNGVTNSQILILDREPGFDR